MLYVIFFIVLSCVKYLFLFFNINLHNNNYPLAWPWRTLCTASRMSYAVTSVRPLSPLSTVTFVTYIYAKPVCGNITFLNLKITTLCHLNCGELLLNVQNIPQKYVDNSVQHVTFQYVHYVCVVSSLNISGTKKSTF